MKTIKFLSTCLMLVIATSANAQKGTGEISIIPRIGMTLSNMTDMDIIASNGNGPNNMETSRGKMKVGVTAGADAEFQALPSLGISLGLHYSLQGCHHSGTNDFKSFDTNLHYINIPLLANIYIGSGFALRGGVYMGIKIGDSEGYKTFNPEYKTIDMAIPFGLTYEWNNFILGARYNFGITNVPKLKDFKSKNQVVVIDLGYRI